MSNGILVLMFYSALLLTPQYAGAKNETSSQLPSSVMSKPDLPPANDAMPETADHERGNPGNAAPPDGNRKDGINTHRHVIRSSSGQQAIAPTVSSGGKEGDE